MATSATNLLKRFSFPKVPGDQPWSIIDVAGPLSYVQLVPGAVGPPSTPPSGAQRVTAQDFGLQALDFVVAMANPLGLYFGLIVPLGGTLTVPRLFLGDDMEAVLLVWMLIAGGQAAAGTNLSTTRLRLLGIGR